MCSGLGRLCVTVADARAHVAASLHLTRAPDVAQTPKEIKEMAAKMLGQKLITKQTGAAGRICNTVAIVETVQTKSEKYFAILMDRAYGGPVVVASATGGKPRA